MDQAKTPASIVPTTEQRKEALRRADIAMESGEQATIGQLDPFDALRVAHLQQRHALRKGYAGFFKWGLAVQIGIADVVFIIYASVMHFHVPPTAISAWLGALVVQVISVVVVITKGLFPAEAADFHSSERKGAGG